jgi:hypothetical protein
MRALIVTVLLAFVLAGCAPRRHYNYGGPSYGSGHYRSSPVVLPYNRPNPGLGHGWGRR